MNYDGILQFKYTWRTYQARVLQRAENYLADGKIHIVAAPGSGKTTLGIELIRRLNRNALVLTPTVTIREQWMDRIREAFLCEGIDGSDYLSQDLKHPKAITVATYQALHSAMIALCGAEKAEDSGIRLVEIMKKAQIGTLCLDECHHLRNEWWKALEEFKKQMGSLKVVALTATPPYDSAPAMWSRYINMCGEIDEEITVPELVKEGSLCPHQDYVYFNYPTKKEEVELKKFEARGDQMLDTLMPDEQFLAAVRTYKGLGGALSDDALLEDPAALSAVMIYLKSRNVPVPPRLLRLLGGSKLPKMDKRWMERLLQSFLYDHVDDFACDMAYREELIARLKAAGLIEKKKVMMVKNAETEKLLISSAGKCDSIREIVFSEYHALGSGLRLLVLTDYIRKEYEKRIGSAEDADQVLGVLPFFDMLRLENERRCESVRFGVLCGSVVIIPAEARAALERAVEGVGSVTFGKVGRLSEEDYLKVIPSGDAHFLTGAVTKIFSDGYIQALIGTKSLLGEGWDSPCINSLILASFVGSFMLSNQMRGRAIRVFKEQPDKTSNIWHLVCLPPARKTRQSESDEISEDFSMLVRRMDHFLGLHYTENSIESGLARLSVIRPPFTKKNTENINRQMLEISRDRGSLRERWRSALCVFDRMETVNETEVDDRLITKAVFYDALLSCVLTGIAAGICITVGRISGAFLQGTGLNSFFSYLGLAGFAYMVSRFPKLFMLGSPFRRLKAFGGGIRKALESKGLFEEPANRVEAEILAADQHAIYLLGGTGRDKALFAKCVSEFFDPLENQRYILVSQKRRKGNTGYFAVPDCFSGRREDAEFFASCMRPYIGKYTAVYTRNEAGRKLLLKGRIKALANREVRCITHEKVKGAFE